MRIRYPGRTATRGRAVLPALLALLATGACAGHQDSLLSERTDLHARRIERLEAEKRARYYAEERARLAAERRACPGACGTANRCMQ